MNSYATNNHSTSTTAERRYATPFFRKGRFTLYLMSMILCSLLFNIPAYPENNVRKWPVSTQVGMYSYRAKDLVGYTSLNPEGQIINKIIIKRDPQDEIIKKEHLDISGRLKSMFTYTFDSKNRLVKKIKKSGEGQILRSHTYYYDDNNLLFRQVDKDENDNITKTHDYFYNRKGERLRKITYNADNGLKKSCLYVFNTDDRRIADYTLSSDGNISGSTKYFYNSAGLITRIQYFNDKFALRGESIITLDSQGRPFKKGHLDPKGKVKSVLHYHYEGQ